MPATVSRTDSLFRQSIAPVLSPQPDTDWASTAVLNPAILEDPESGRLHMLFRATGPGAERRMAGETMPYPIFLGYAWSDDEGKSWEADFSRPALAPALETDTDRIVVKNALGETVLNHANGCIEDPRLFLLDGQVWMSAACRMFPPGPYWEKDDPMQCAPAWARQGRSPFGRAADENITVSVLYRVDLERLRARDYSRAFFYVGPISNPDGGDNRDVFLFPEKLQIDGRPQYVCLHRPYETSFFDPATAGMKPSIFLAAADEIRDLATVRARHRLLAQPVFDWEAGRIGASSPPLPLGNGEWLLPCHGKQDAVVGYTQSFMILREQEHGFPEIVHRCSERILYARYSWELAGEFPTPCVFTCSGIVLGETFLAGYGAADTRIGIARANFDELVAHVRRFDSVGMKG